MPEKRKRGNKQSLLKILIIPNPDVVNINTYTKFGQNPSSVSQDTERKRNADINQGS